MVFNRSREINRIIISPEQATAAQSQTSREIGKLEAPDDQIQRKRVMPWYQSKFDASSSTGDKAVIESIATTAIEVVFENNAGKKAMLTRNTKYPRQWQRLCCMARA